jgi:hypothetical protein
LQGLWPVTPRYAIQRRRDGKWLVRFDPTRCPRWTWATINRFVFETYDRARAVKARLGEAVRVVNITAGVDGSR